MGLTNVDLTIKSIDLDLISYNSNISYNKDKKDNRYEPKKIIYNGKATVVFWKDGTKTVVKKSEGNEYSKYNAFCAALAKKIFGTNSAVNRTVASGIEQK